MSTFRVDLPPQGSAARDIVEEARWKDRWDSNGLVDLGPLFVKHGSPRMHRALKRLQRDYRWYFQKVGNRKLLPGQWCQFKQVGPDQFEYYPDPRWSPPSVPVKGPYKPTPGTKIFYVWRYIENNRKDNVVDLTSMNEKFGAPCVALIIKAMRDKRGWTITPVNPGKRDSLFHVSRKRGT